MAFKFKKTGIDDVILVSSDRYSDERGFFEEDYKLSDFSYGEIRERFAQINHSFSRRGVLRGLHYQKAPHSQGKLVFVVRGKIMDVAVDIRQSSSSFKRWVSVILSDGEGHLLWIPTGFAHGFLALEDSDVIYLTTSEYGKEYESGVRWNDPDINIKWPTDSPILSEKDGNLPFIKEMIERGELQP
ncbi:MAG: dTDP-4-dehydrorhamnose 3,5-epimerase [Thermoplasmatales archaeon]|nr:dTDP-4-dehydrorhamnose 3,5-epimerase [Candidatus Thermoplasmatota archaeon]MDA8056165.1 dTDP-4-dehydrorhamnose 3,5-epimerase [Thermoplasmatales archaeon]